MIEGIDFSAGGFPTVATLKANGKAFVFTYAVDDVGPRGRSLTTNVCQQYLANGIDIGVYWEGKAEWMLGGWDAGVAAAQNGQRNLARLGLPLIMPLHFAHDIDPDPAHFHQIDQCLSGAASAIGWDRVGAYGGWLLIDYLAGGGNVKRLVQTIAWEYGRGLHPAATAYQYDTRNIPFDGVPCDLVRAVKPNFGQATLFRGAPTPKPDPAPNPKPPTYGEPALPTWWGKQKALQFPTDEAFGGGTWVAARRKSVVLRATAQRTVASAKGRKAGPDLKAGDVVHVERLVKAGDGRQWAVLRAGGPVGKDGVRVLHDDLKDTPEIP